MKELPEDTKIIKFIPIKKDQIFNLYVFNELIDDLFGVVLDQNQVDFSVRQLESGQWVLVMLRMDLQ